MSFFYDRERNLYFDRQGNPLGLFQWARLFDDPATHRVAQTRINEVLVSTAWMGLDMNYLRIGPPLIFETMIFGLDEDDDMEEYQWRWSTETQALAGHDQAVAMVTEVVSLRSDHITVTQLS